jgi:hypothetical protein
MATKPANAVSTKRGRKTGIGALPFTDIAQFHATFYPEFDSHLWQLEEQYRLSGHLDGDPTSPKVDFNKDHPYIGGIAAANGSGKDSVLVAPAVGYFISKYEMMDVVLTSASHTQLSGQTQTYIRDLCDRVNTKLGVDYFIYKDMSVLCPDTGSRIILFATDEEGRAEGFHPREPGRKFAVVLNEVKTIEDRIIHAVLRCSDYTHWLEVSSPGPTTGHFYKSCSAAHAVYPAALVPGKQFFRRVTAFECPHISQVHINRIREELGEDSPLYRSSVLAEFTNTTDLFFCPAHLLNYKPLPLSQTYGMPRKAGLDLSLGGGAATVLYVRQGANFVGLRDWKIRHEPTLHKRLIEAFKDFRLEPQNINVDGGGMGQLIIQRLHEGGWPVNTVKNESTKVSDKRHFSNVGAELYWRVRRLHEDQLISPPTHPSVVSQLTNRKYEYGENNAKIKCVSKPAMHAQGLESPDYSDAYVLAFAGESIADYHRSRRRDDNTFIDSEGKKRWRVGAAISKENLLTLEEQMHQKAGLSLLGPKGLLTNIDDYADYKSRTANAAGNWTGTREPENVWRDYSE